MSTIRVNAIQSTSTTDGGISIDTSGHVTLDGQSLPSAGPLSNRNLIINGAMQVAQRGTSRTDLGYLVDRFNTGWSQGAVTTSQQSLTSGDPYNEGFRYFMRQQNTTSSTAINAYRHLNQRIEGQNIAQSGWNFLSSSSFITLSFWARASVAQDYYVQLQTFGGTEYKYSFSFSLSADTWTKVTKTIPGNSSLIINNDNAAGFDIKFIPFYGTNYTDSGSSDDVWESYTGTSQLPDMTNTWGGTTNATFDITGVQLEVGSVATPFEHRSYGDELARCQRYFYKIDGSSSAIRTANGITNVTDASNNVNIMTKFGVGSVWDGDDGSVVVPLPVTMRADPTTDSAGLRLAAGSSIYNTTTTIQDNRSSIYAGSIQLDNDDASGMTSGQACMLVFEGNAYLSFASEL